MSTGDATKRKRNRWGAKNTSSNHDNNNNNTTDAAITADEKAVEALLQSAQSNEQQKRPQPAAAAQHKQKHTHRQRYETPSDDLTHQFKSRDNINDKHRQDGNFKRQRRQRHQEDCDESSYQWGPQNTNTANQNTHAHTEHQQQPDTDSGEKKPMQKPNFGLSGALAQDDDKGNIYNGVLLKFTEPPEARTPNTRWRLYVFKKNLQQASTSQSNTDKPDSADNDDDLLDVMHVSKQSAYLFGRDRKVADIPVDHPSLSKQHCVLQFRALPDASSSNRQIDQPQKLRCKPYMMDLESTNGTFVNGVKLEPARYYELRKGDIITLGFSSREYVLLTENTTST